MHCVSYYYICLILQNQSLSLNFSGSLPELTAPSVIVKGDGFSYITGCVYTTKENDGMDLAEFSYLLINNDVKIKLNGNSTENSISTFQLPESRFIIPGEYQCLIEAPGLYHESILSPSSPYIQMPGRYTEKSVQIF